MAEVTIMVLKVDLNCYKCFKKVKKVLCGFPQIRDQVYDEKQNTVTIKVVSCCPENIRQKIGRKGGKSIKSIDIKPPEKKPEKPKAPAPQPRKEPEKKKEAEEQKPPVKGNGQGDGKKKTETPGTGSGKSQGSIRDIIDRSQISKPQPEPCYGYPIPSAVCCRDCYEGRGEGPCQQLGYVCRYPCYCGCYGRPVFDSWGGSNQGYYRSRNEIYGEENPSTCSVM